ncbi:MAG: hypothetical protein WC928_01065 [Patescibacteria group bacterium]|jgi:cytochrome bd-type quinol oxidase subunit 2
MKNAKNILLVLVFSLILVFSMKIEKVSASYWDNQIGLGEVGMAFGQDQDVEDIRYKIVKLINVILTVLGLITVVLIIYAGFLWMTSAGNEESVKKAQAILKNAIIGLVIILISWSVTYFIMRRLRAVVISEYYYTNPLD